MDLRNFASQARPQSAARTAFALLGYASINTASCTRRLISRLRQRPWRHVLQARTNLGHRGNRHAQCSFCATYNPILEEDDLLCVDRDPTQHTTRQRDRCLLDERHLRNSSLNA